MAKTKKRRAKRQFFKYRRKPKLILIEKQEKEKIAIEEKEGRELLERFTAQCQKAWPPYAKI